MIIFHSLLSQFKFACQSPSRLLNTILKIYMMNANNRIIFCCARLWSISDSTQAKVRNSAIVLFAGVQETGQKGKQD